jgi:hypothetical protein
MCIVQLPPGGDPLAVNKYISYHISYDSGQAEWSSLYLPNELQIKDLCNKFAHALILGKSYVN